MEREIISTCIRILIFSTGVFVVNITLLDHVLPRRRPLTVMLLFMASGLFIKNVFCGYLLSVMEMDEVMIKIIRFIFITAYMVLSYVILCYTYFGSVLKIGCMMMIFESDCMMIQSVILILLNGLSKRPWGEYIRPLSFLDVLILPVWFIFCLAELYFLKPFLPRIRYWEPKHRTVFWIILAVYMGGAWMTSTVNDLISSSMLDYKIAFGVYTVMVLCCLAGIYIYMEYRRQNLRTRAFVHAQKELMALHYRAVCRQIEKMERDQKVIDSQMKKIVAMDPQDAGKNSGKIRRYLASLQQKYEEIQAGIYCGDYLVDGVLYHAAKECRKQGIVLDVAFRNYDRGNIQEEDMAELVGQILEYGRREAKSLSEQKDGPSRSLTLFLHAERLKNQLLLEFHCPSEKIPKKIRHDLKKRLIFLLIPCEGEIVLPDKKKTCFLIRLKCL